MFSLNVLSGFVTDGFQGLRCAKWAEVASYFN